MTFVRRSMIPTALRSSTAAARSCGGRFIIRRDLQISSFADLNPRGFGLMQRQKDFSAYQDLESNFERRPSLWAEPIGDWGEGSVKLIEIPTKEEIHDNIASFWQPKTPLQAKGEHTYTYRLHWGPDAPKPSSLARFSRTGIGAKGDNATIFVLDLIGDRLKSVDPKSLRGVVTAEKAKIQNIVTQPNPATGGWRLSFELVEGKGSRSRYAHRSCRTKRRYRRSGYIDGHPSESARIA